MRPSDDSRLLLTQRSGSETFGPLRIDWNLSFDETTIQVRLYLSGQQVDLGVITRQQPNFPFDVAQGNDSAKGVLTGQFATAGQAQLLRGDFEWCVLDQCQSFKGIIANFGG
ncbi:MAG: hypothetical protein KDD11_09070 [Acidobacteria bacterium]|nr:hypothetical protein [Acidobacteriota bacterium]